VGKVKLTVWIDEETYALLKAYVVRKYQKLHGVLGEEVDRAIRLLLSLESQENSEEALFKAYKPSRKYVDLLRWLYDKGLRDELITDTAIKQYIRFNLGVKSKSSIYSYYNFAKMFLVEEEKTEDKVTVFSVDIEKIEKYAKIHNIKLEEPIRTTVKEPISKPEPSKVTIRGFEVSLETASRRTPKPSALAEIVMDLYQSGYSVSEIVSKLEALGLDVSVSKVKNIIRRELRNELV